MPQNRSPIDYVARVGLSAKGFVYVLLGLLAFMAAFHLSDQSAGSTDKTGVFQFIEKQPGGKVMLAALAIGLICYVLWRFFQALFMQPHSDVKSKHLAKRFRYFFSGVAYSAVAFSVIKRLFASRGGSGDSWQRAADALLNKPYGPVLVGAIAMVLLSLGLYQIYYGFSEKYKKHINSALPAEHRNLVLKAGKIGYLARGIVWLLMSILFFRAAIYSNPSHAGDTSKAFQFLKDASLGTYLLAAVALGLICYGVFNFIRARYEAFHD
ncbi:MAG: DUF1206 domain-containing protein [Flavobacterium sp.]|nr:MAG: DUF1206 domain-containing protein [Flavobacterium sp.]